MDTNQIVDTNAYYKEHAEEYIKATENIDMSREHEMFERHLGEGQQFILDVMLAAEVDVMHAILKVRVTMSLPLILMWNLSNMHVTFKLMLIKVM